MTGTVMPKKTHTTLIMTMQPHALLKIMPARLMNMPSTRLVMAITIMPPQISSMQKKMLVQPATLAITQTLPPIMRMRLIRIIAVTVITATNSCAPS